jgi:hypothetical protein
MLPPQISQSPPSPRRVRGAADSSRREFDFGKAAGRGCLNSFYDTLDVKTMSRPLLLTRHHDCDLATGKILLVAHVLVRGQ